MSVAASSTSPGKAAGSGVPLVIATLISWASIPLFLRYFVSSIDAWTANGWRYGLSALFWLPLLGVAYARGRLPRTIFVAALLPTAFNIAGQTCFAWGPYFLDPGFMTFVFRVQIVFVTVGAWLLFPQERATLKSGAFWIGVVLVAGGSIGLVLFKTPLPLEVAAAQAHAIPYRDSPWGIPIAVLSGALFAGYALTVRRNMHGYSPVLAFGVICQYTAAGTVLLMLLVGAGHGAAVLGFGGVQWAMLVGSSMIGIAISHVLYYAALTRLGVAVSMGIIQLQPVLTGVASMLIFDERLNAWQWVCGLVGVAGAIVILTAGKRTGQAAAARQGEKARPDAQAATDAGT